MPPPPPAPQSLLARAPSRFAAAIVEDEQVEDGRPRLPWDHGAQDGVEVIQNGPAPEGTEIRIHSLTGPDTQRVQQAVRLLNDSGIGPTNSARLEAIRDLAGSHDSAAVAALQTEAR